MIQAPSEKGLWRKCRPLQMRAGSQISAQSFQPLKQAFTKAPRKISSSVTGRITTIAITKISTPVGLISRGKFSLLYPLFLLLFYFYVRPQFRPLAQYVSNSVASANSYYWTLFGLEGLYAVFTGFLVYRFSKRAEKGDKAARSFL